MSSPARPSMLLCRSVHKASHNRHFIFSLYLIQDSWKGSCLLHLGVRLLVPIVHVLGGIYHWVRVSS